MFPVEVTRMTWAVWTAAGRQGAVLGNVLRCDAGQRVKVCCGRFCSAAVRVSLCVSSGSMLFTGSEKHRIVRDETLITLLAKMFLPVRSTESPQPKKRPLPTPSQFSRPQANTHLERPSYHAHSRTVGELIVSEQQKTQP
eukprot:scaffold30533_cov19-Tisochrysis_lutea.AAC.1